MNEIKEIIAFETKDGKEPFTGWFDKLRDSKLKGKILERLNRVRHGNYGYHNRLGSDFLELKEKIGGGTRVYIGEDGSRLVVLLLGGNKSLQSRDIAKAKEYWKEYKNSKK